MMASSLRRLSLHFITSGHDGLETLDSFAGYNTFTRLYIPSLDIFEMSSDSSRWPALVFTGDLAHILRIHSSRLRVVSMRNVLPMSRPSPLRTELSAEQAEAGTRLIAEVCWDKLKCEVIFFIAKEERYIFIEREFSCIKPFRSEPILKVAEDHGLLEREGGWDFGRCAAGAI